MKRILCMALLLSLLLAACAGGQRSASSAAAAEPSAPESAVSAPVPSAPTVSASAAESAKPTAFDPDSLGAAAAAYYERRSGWRPHEFEVRDNGDGTYTIHLFETVDDGGGTSHTATAAWYTVNAEGVGEDDVMGGAIDLNS